MRWQPVLFVALLTFVLVAIAAASELAEEDTRHHIRSVSGLSMDEAEGLVEKVWRELLDEGDHEYASVMLADVDGDKQEEAIVAVSISWRGEGVVAIFRKQGEDYALLGRISCDGGSLEVKTVDLLGDGRQALIIESLTGGAKWGRHNTQVYRWDEEDYVKLWEGVTYEDGFSLDYRYNVEAEVRFIDLNSDKVREVVRSGMVYRSEWDKWPELVGTSLPEIEVDLFPDRLRKLGISGPGVDFEEVTSGYEAVYRFRETFFYHREFDRYIRYKARVIRDTETQEANMLERTPVAAGTEVGVLGILSEAYIRFLSLDLHVSVALPDSRIVPLDRGVLERIYQ